MERYLKTFSGRKASQSHYELTSFIDFLVFNKVKRYAEIGAREGDTFHEIMLNLGKDAYGLAVDLPGGLWGKSTTGRQLQAAINDLRKTGHKAQYIHGDSTHKDVIANVAQRAPYDCILIDGDHTLEGVTKDWENYKGMGKFIAFHDIVGTGQREKVSKREVEVPILWERLKKEHPHVEFIAPGSAMGIGICILA